MQEPDRIIEKYTESILAGLKPYMVLLEEHDHHPRTCIVHGLQKAIMESIVSFVAETSGIKNLKDAEFSTFEELEAALLKQTVIFVDDPSKNMTPEQLEEFKNEWKKLMEAPMQAWKTPIITTGEEDSNWIEFQKCDCKKKREDNKDI